MKVVESETLSEPYDRRYVVIDETTGETLDDAQGYGYKSPQAAHRAYGYKSASPAKKQQRDAVKAQVRDWCRKNSAFIDDVHQEMLWALKDGEEFTESSLVEMVTRRGLVLPFPVKDLMKHW